MDKTGGHGSSMIEIMLVVSDVGGGVQLRPHAVSAKSFLPEGPQGLTLA